MFRSTNHRFVTCICLALVAHLSILLLPWQPKSGSIAQPTTLQIRLTAAPKSQLVEPVENEVAAASQDQLAEAIDTPIEADTTDRAEAEIEVIKPQSAMPIPSLNRQVLISKIKGIINEPRPEYRTFSRADFVSKALPLKTSRPVSIPLMIASATAVSSQSAAGQATDLIRSANGDAMCWQQRGIPGETQQWYRVPLALCGHLNQPSR